MSERGPQLYTEPPEPESRSANLASRWLVLGLAAVLPLAVHVLLWRVGVPLGCPGRFVYLYSPVVSWRLSAVPPAVVLAAMLGLGVWWTAAADTRRRRLGFVTVVAGSVAVATVALGGCTSWKNTFLSRS